MCARTSNRTTPDLITAEKQETDPGITTAAAAAAALRERDDWGLYGTYRFYCTVCKRRDEQQRP